jgi:hypothetical protein
MIFKRELAEAIVRGEKTATRRVMNKNPRSPWYRERCAYKIGQVFTINPGRGVKGIGLAKVTDVYWQRVDDVGERDARREGLESLARFLHVFGDINPKAGLNTPIWVVEFEVVK